MKNYFNTLFTVVVISVLFLASCQNETTNQNDNKISANSNLKKLLSRVTQKRTSSDNIIDSTSCFTVQMPFSVIVNDQQIDIETQADYETVAANFDEHEHNHIHFIFPITVTFIDFTQLVITNQQQLHSVMESCEFHDVDHDGDNHNDDDDNAINCLSLTYPFVISITNNGVQQDSTITNDHELYQLIENVIGSVSVTINYPISVIDDSGQTITINNNAELENKIEDAIENCGSINGEHENDNDHHHNSGHD